MKIEMISQMVNGVYNHFITKAILGSIVGVFGYFFDIGLAPAILTLTTLSVLDLFSAFLARGEKPVEPFSRPIRKTAHKIAGYYVSISSVFIVSKTLLSSTGIDLMAFDNVLIGFFLVHEVISIIENLNKAGIPIPLPFLDKLKKVKDIIGNK